MPSSRLLPLPSPPVPESSSSLPPTRINRIPSSPSLLLSSLIIIIACLHGPTLAYFPLHSSPSSLLPAAPHYNPFDSRFMLYKDLSGGRNAALVPQPAPAASITRQQVPLKPGSENSFLVNSRPAILLDPSSHSQNPFFPATPAAETSDYEDMTVRPKDPPSFHHHPSLQPPHPPPQSSHPKLQAATESSPKPPALNSQHLHSSQSQGVSSSERQQAPPRDDETSRRDSPSSNSGSSSSGNSKDSKDIRE